MDTVHIGAMIGSVVGILGGAIGTYLSIRNTNGPRERRFVIRTSIVLWLALGLTALVAFLLPPVRAWAWVPIGVMVMVGAPAWNRRQAAIRREEAGE